MSRLSSKDIMIRILEGMPPQIYNNIKNRIEPNNAGISTDALAERIIKDNASRKIASDEYKIEIDALTSIAIGYNGSNGSS